MTILLLEDRGAVSTYLCLNLKEQGHIVYECNNIPTAKEYWLNESENIDCLIVDINMPPLGLSESQIEETKSGLLTGWVWLKYYILPSRPEMKDRIIVYSAYLEELRKYYPNEIKGVKLVPKGDVAKPNAHISSLIKNINILK